MTTIIAVILGVASFAGVFGLVFWVAHLYRTAGDRRRRLLRAALAAAFIVSAGQVAGGRGGYAAAFPVIFGAWVLAICVVAATWDSLNRRRVARDHKAA